jgi:hypothetical protein
MALMMAMAVMGTVADMEAWKTWFMTDMMTMAE